MLTAMRQYGHSAAVRAHKAPLRPQVPGDSTTPLGCTTDQTNARFSGRGGHCRIRWAEPEPHPTSAQRRSVPLLCQRALVKLVDVTSHSWPPGNPSIATRLRTAELVATWSGSLICVNAGRGRMSQGCSRSPWGGPRGPTRRPNRVPSRLRRRSRWSAGGRRSSTHRRSRLSRRPPASRVRPTALRP